MRGGSVAQSMRRTQQQRRRRARALQVRPEHHRANACACVCVRVREREGLSWRGASESGGGCTGLGWGRCVVVEDSLVGLRAAKGAGMPCIITYTDSTKDQDFYKEVPLIPPPAYI